MSGLDYLQLCVGRARLAEAEVRESAEIADLLEIFQTDLAAALRIPAHVRVQATLGDRPRVDGTHALALAIQTPTGPIVVHGSVQDRREADGRLRWWDVELDGARMVGVHPDSPKERAALVAESISAVSGAAGLAPSRPRAPEARNSAFFRRPETDPQLQPWRREAPGWARARLREVQRTAELDGLRAALPILWAARKGLRRELAWTLHRLIRAWNALLLPPLAVLIVLEFALGGLPELLRREMNQATLLFCSCFGLEFVLAWGLARNRWRFVWNIWNIADFVSTLPLATMFQVARLGRASRVIRMIRLVKLVRGRRLSMPIRRTFWAFGVAASAILSGAIALEAVEQQVVPDLGDAVWWSLVTVSTVGYGDITPETALGRAVAGVLMVIGLGVFSYTTGQFTAAVDDPEEARILQTVEESRRHILRMEARVLALCDAAGGNVAGDASVEDRPRQAAPRPLAVPSE